MRAYAPTIVAGEQRFTANVISISEELLACGDLRPDHGKELRFGTARGDSRSTPRIPADTWHTAVVVLQRDLEPQGEVSRLMDATLAAGRSSSHHEARNLADVIILYRGISGT